MISRRFRSGNLRGVPFAPPPLHVYDAECEAAAWHPLPRVVLRPTTPGPEMIKIPIAAPFGEDPLDPAGQTRPRWRTTGMIGRFHEAEKTG